jgi:hypothetical protein
MIAAKTQKGVSKVYLIDLRYRLGMFADSFRCDSSLSRRILRFFAAIKLGPCSFNNCLRTVRTFCHFAQDRGWPSRMPIQWYQEAEGNEDPGRDLFHAGDGGAAQARHTGNRSVFRPGRLCRTAK